jgi:hypothetical protein
VFTSRPRNRDSCARTTASKKETIASKKREARWDRQREGDAAYRAALGIAGGGELPKQIGNTASAGAGRARAKVVHKTRKNSTASGGRAKLIG